MSDVVIQVEGLSKQYRLGEVSTRSLGHDLNRWWHRVRGNPDPYLNVTQANIRDSRSEGRRPSSGYVWALKDVNFEVKRGEVLGIIGRNGAGKSTLLKILSRITAPTAGEIRIDGRIAALLEVGTGFHQDLTGRENIYLNGAILGMTRREITSKLDEIIAFSGCERYVDTPVKRYSSGMVVRLGFAVAAHLEPEILIIDEVLAVGDAEFQKKCIGKMKDVASRGRTVLFVSHNMGAVAMLCDRAILLAGGEIKESGQTDDMIARYTAAVREEVQVLSLAELRNRDGDQRVSFHGFSIQREGRSTPAVSGSPVDLVFALHAKEACKGVDLGFSIHDEHDGLLSVLYSGYQEQTFSMKAGETRDVVFSWPRVFLAPGTYFVRGRLLADGGQVADCPKTPLGMLRVETGDFYGTGQTGFRGRSLFLLKGEWGMR
jgi:lipopolysaccharide transport system ATP-binding protein